MWYNLRYVNSFQSIKKKEDEKNKKKKMKQINKQTNKNAT